MEPETSSTESGGETDSKMSRDEGTAVSDTDLDAPPASAAIADQLSSLEAAIEELKRRGSTSAPSTPRASAPEKPENMQEMNSSLEKTTQRLRAHEHMTTEDQAPSASARAAAGSSPETSPARALDAESGKGKAYAKQLQGMCGNLPEKARV